LTSSEEIKLGHNPQLVPPHLPCPIM